MTEETEEWRIVPGTHIKVSNLGRVYHRCRMMTSPAKKFGAGGCLGQICHLVLLAFVGPRPEGMECCHLDDNNANNRLSNLRWGTKRDNALDAFRNGKKHPAKGTQNGRSKLTSAQVTLIRLLAYSFRSMWTDAELARVFGIAVPGIYRIVHRQSWTHVP